MVAIQISSEKNNYLVIAVNSYYLDFFKSLKSEVFPPKLKFQNKFPFYVSDLFHGVVFKRTRKVVGKKNQWQTKQKIKNLGLSFAKYS